MKGQPIDSVEWVSPKTLTANDYNPNKVAPPELRLLKLSLLENGWTQPIVATPDDVIVDGFHRWTLGSTDREVIAMTDGLVPVVRLDADVATLRMATIRHNRARGSHHVLKMADIVAFLIEEAGVDPEEVMRRLGMDDEEVDRLLDRGQMTKRGAGDDWSSGWKPI